MNPHDNGNVDPLHEELVLKATRGDVDALEWLLREHESYVRRLIAVRFPAKWRRIISDDDLVLQSFAEAFHAISRFEPRGAGSFRGWLRTIVLHNVLDTIKWLERNARDVELRSDGAHGATPLDAWLCGDDTSPTQHARRQERQDILHAAVQQLPDAYRPVVQLSLEGRSVAEIARELNLTEGAVGMRLLRARLLLVDLMPPDSDFFSDRA